MIYSYIEVVLQLVSKKKHDIKRNMTEGYMAEKIPKCARVERKEIEKQ